MATKSVLDDLLQTRSLRPKASHDQGNFHLDLNRSKHHPSASSSGGELQWASTLCFKTGSATARCSKRKDAETHSLHQDAHDDLASSPCLTKEEALAFCRHKGIIRPPPSHAGHRCWRRASDCCRGCVPAACPREPDCEVAPSSRSALASRVACQQATQLPTSHPSEAALVTFVTGA